MSTATQTAPTHLQPAADPANSRPHSPYHQQAQQATQVQPQQATQPQQAQAPQVTAQGAPAGQMSANPAASLMQLRQDIPPAPPMRATRKRKSPPSGSVEGSAAPPPPGQPAQQPTQVQPQPQHQPPPPPHMHPGPPPHGVYLPFAYNPDYSSAGLPPHLLAHLTHPQAAQPPPPPPQQQQPGGDKSPAATRQLSTSKRAEQNRKAQRAFRERRDQHVKTLESRSQLLDAALASADEANRRWEECRALVDQLRVENASLRAALSQANAQMASAVQQQQQQQVQAAAGATKTEMTGADGVQDGGANGAGAHSRQPSIGAGGVEVGATS